MSWETYGLTAVVLLFVAWKLWDTTSMPTERANAKKLFFGRCVYEWRHFLTDLSRAAVILVSLAIGINLASNIYDAAGTVDVLVKEVVVEREVPKEVQKIVVNQDVKEIEKVVVNEKVKVVQKVVENEVVKWREVQRPMMTVLNEILEENPSLKTDRMAFVRLLEELLLQHLGAFPPGVDGELNLRFPNGPNGQFNVGGDLKVKN